MTSIQYIVHFFHILLLNTTLNRKDVNGGIEQGRYNLLLLEH